MDDDVDTEPDEAEPAESNDDEVPPPLAYRPQGSWLEDRLEEYAERLEELNSPD